ncbi:MAG: hypothetical protein J7621_22410 [Niastella sp.]|nr:hypothetical protein [Niastella sp.]
MNGNILVHTLVISRAGEQQYFQLNIPRDVTAITGIITSVQLVDVPQVGGTGQVGMLQLQATGKPNGCYNSIVKLEPAVALKTDLGLTTYQAGFTQTNALITNGIAQRGLTSPETFQLPSCNSFYGNYRDLLGKGLQQDVRYRVNITLYTQRKKL